MMRSLLQDLRYGMRVLAKSPGFAGAAILTLAFAIGANAALFALVDALFFQALPIRDPSRLVAIYRVTGKGEEAGILLPQVQEIERHQQVFSTMAGWRTDWLVTTETNGALSQSEVDGVSGEYFSMLGVRPLLGRLFTSDEINENRGLSAHVAVIDYRFWQRCFGSDPAVIGKNLRIAGISFSIIGVTAKNYVGLQVGTSSDVTVPLTGIQEIELADNRISNISASIRLNYALGQLKPGVTLAQARAQVQSLWPGILATTVPLDLGPQQRAAFLRTQVTLKSAATGFSFLRDRYAYPLFVLMFSAGLILLIACINLASLTLARSAARDHEMAVRAAVGASPRRLARQLLTENLLLSVSGGVLGMGLSVWASRALAHFVWPSVVPMALDLQPSLHVFALCFLVTLLTGVSFSLAPGWYSVRQNSNTILQQKLRAPRRRVNRLRKCLIVTQLALSVVLLVGAGVFVRSLEKLRATSLGFHTQHILLLVLLPMPRGYQHLDQASYHRELTERLTGLPGVLSISISHFLPGDGARFGQDVTTESSLEEGRGALANIERVSPGFFVTMGLNLSRGRDFGWQDDSRAQRVAVITQSLARLLFSGREALGQRIHIGKDKQQPSIEIIGVVSDSRIEAIKDSESLMVFVPEAQEPQYMSSPIVEVRTDSDSPVLRDAIGQTVESLRHEYPIMMETAKGIIDTSILPERIMALLSEIYVMFALLLVSIGLYGLISYTVTQRAREIGIRIALGARRTGILWMVLRETLALISVSFAIGLPCAMVATRLVGHILVGLPPVDSMTFVIVVGVLTGVGVMASYFPARRAMSVDPSAVLRAE
jgi:predicted permease